MSEPSARPRLRVPLRRRWRLLAAPLVALAVVAAFVAHVLEDGSLPQPGAGWWPGGRDAHTYYVSPGGDDGNSGRSPADAWKTLSRAESATYQPGDRLRLEGGARFAGYLRLTAGEAGDPTRPVVVDSYGDGRATIEPGPEAGITIHNTGGVEIHDLDIVGPGADRSATSGVHIYNDGTERFEHIEVSGVSVTGFRHGIDVGAAGTVGFSDVIVADSELYGNREAGFSSWAAPLDPVAPVYAHEDLVVRAVVARENLGDAGDLAKPTGNGIVLGSVRRGLVESSIAYDNGVKSLSQAGPIGIWTYDSTEVVIQHCVSARNQTSGLDGGGFGLDVNVSASTLQYNLSYENEGAGILIYAGERAFNRDNMVRFNVSHNDSRGYTNYGGINIFNSIGLELYHNTVVLGAYGASQPAALQVGGDQTGTAIRNNILVGLGTYAVLAEKPLEPSLLTIQGNDIYAEDHDYTVVWGTNAYETLADWRVATGHERAGSTDTGLSVAPMFVDAAPNVDGHQRAAAFALDPQSPLIGAAPALTDLSGEIPTDYFGNPVTGAIGAIQP